MVLINKIRNFIVDNNMLKFGDKVVAGISGGADSVCLLKVLLLLKKEFGLEIFGVHVNHGIRGEEALRDENFVKELCDSVGVRLFTFHYNIPLLAKEDGTTEEETGRIYRYKAFYETAERVGKGKIAVAHNMNDNCETVLQRLIRGTGIKGLGGIEPVRGSIIRPLLCVSRKEIEKFVGAEGFITDSTNICRDYTRNKIRLEVLPLLEEFNPGIVQGICRMSRLARQEDSFLEKTAADILEKAVLERREKEVVLDTEKIGKADEALIGRVLRQAILPFTKKGQDIDCIHITELKKLVFGENGKRIDLIEGIKAIKEFGKIRIGFFNNSIEYSYCVEIGKKTFIKEAGLELLISVDKADGIEPICTVYGKVFAPIIARTVKSGDRIAIKTGRQEIKKAFAGRKIGQDNRYKYPVLEDSRGILAIVGVKARYCTDKNNKIFVYAWKKQTFEKPSEI